MSALARLKQRRAIRFLAAIAALVMGAALSISGGTAAFAATQSLQVFFETNQFECTTTGTTLQIKGYGAEAGGSVSFTVTSEDTNFKTVSDTLTADAGGSFASANYDVPHVDPSRSKDYFVTAKSTISGVEQTASTQFSFVGCESQDPQPSSGDVTWNGKNGGDLATANCRPGQSAAYTFILSGNGAKIVDGGTGYASFKPSGSDSAKGDVKGAGGSAHYTVTGPYNGTVTSFVVKGASWTGSDPFLKLSHVDCTGTATPPPPPADQEFTVTYGAQTCVPGANNDTVGKPVVSPSEAATVNEGSWKDGKLTESVTPNKGYKPADGTQLSKDYTDDGGNCGITPPPPVDTSKASLSKECYVVEGNKTGDTVVNATFDNGTMKTDELYGYVETIDGVTNTYPVPVPAGESITAQVFYSPADGKSVTVQVKHGDKVLTEPLTFDTADCVGTQPPPPPPTKSCPAGTKWVDANHNGVVDDGECMKPVPPKPVVTVKQHGGQDCAKTWTWHTTTTTLNGKVVSVVNSPKVYKAKAVNTCSTPSNHVVPGSGAPHTGGGAGLFDLDPWDQLAIGGLLLVGGGLLIRRRELAQVG